ncbi:hypothetical protein GGI12_003916 [Dipsacomyces acuminosporus]|nr:hypothetical protein GGI12_003916 [Dipsacomyces acuminosporus]
MTVDPISSILAANSIAASVTDNTTDATADTTTDTITDNGGLEKLEKQNAQKSQLFTKQNIGVLYSSENWREVETLVNDLRYLLMEVYDVSPLNLKTYQCPSVYDMPLYLSGIYQRSDVVICIGVIYKNSPTYDSRLVGSLTDKLSNYVISNNSKLPAFDCILVKDSNEQFEEHYRMIAKTEGGYATNWANRVVYACNIVLPPTS